MDGFPLGPAVLKVNKVSRPFGTAGNTKVVLTPLFVKPVLLKELSKIVFNSKIFRVSERPLNGFVIVDNFKEPLIFIHLKTVKIAKVARIDLRSPASINCRRIPGIIHGIPLSRSPTRQDSSPIGTFPLPDITCCNETVECFKYFTVHVQPE